MNRVYLCLLCLFLISCASTPPPSVPSAPKAGMNQVNVSEGDSLDMSLMLAQRRAVDRIRNIDSVEPKVKEEPGLKEPDDVEEPVVHKYLLNTKDEHPKVQKWINYYSVKDRERFQRFLNRGAKYKKVIQDLLVTNELPPDLYYLGILESGYVTEAVSHAGAVGPWQFMAPTGRQYGLKINNYVDERIDPIRSTLAAIRYLKELYRLKKSWHMALASYNAGPGRVGRAMRRGRTSNYWDLTRRRLLPYDTREYIPQFLAILYIGKNLEKFDFVEQAEEQLVPMELVKVPSPVKIKDIAKESGIPLDDLEELNPHLNRGVTPPSSKTYHLWVKKNHVAQLSQGYDKIAAHRVSGLRVRRSIARYKARTVHKVRRGQNLSTIASRYGTSVRTIKRLNGLRSNRIYVGQKLKVRGRARSRQQVAWHKVNRGQNLSYIARNYGMKLSQLKRLNKLRSNRIYIGQKLKVYARGQNVGLKKFHKVRKGENLTTIARRYGTTVKKIKRMNGLSRSTIYKGQKLRLIAKKGKVKKYRIRRGDNLYKIAKKFGLTIRKLKSINNLKSNRIIKGQQLIVAVN